VQPKVTKKTKEIKNFLSMEERSATKMKLELRNMLETHVNKTWREMCNKKSSYKQKKLVKKLLIKELLRREKPQTKMNFL
jgi:hypothetical protein